MAASTTPITSIGLVEPVPQLVPLNRFDAVIANYLIGSFPLQVGYTTPHRLQRRLVHSHIQTTLPSALGSLSGYPSERLTTSIGVIAVPKEEGTPEFRMVDASSITHGNLIKYHWFTIDGNHRVHFMLLEMAKLWAPDAGLSEIESDQDLAYKLGLHPEAMWLARVYSSGEH